MKEGWEYKKLGEVCDLYQPKTISTKEMVSDGLYDVFGANGKIGKYHSYNHEHSEILMTCRGATCGNINISTPKSWINGNAMVVHIKDEGMLDRQFLVYSLIHIDKAHIITGAAQPQITRQTLSPLQVCFPSLSEQQSIVDYLDSAFAKIDVMKANAEKALNEAKALFQASLKEMLEPKEGWEEKTLKEITTKISDGSHNPPVGLDFSEYEMLSSKNLRKDSFNFDNPRYLSKEDFEKEDKRTNLEKGDVLLTIVGAGLGDCCVYNFEKKIVFQRSVSVIKPSYDKISSRFLMYTLQHNYNKIRNESNGAAQKGIYLKQLAAYSVLIPPLSEQQNIVFTLDSLKSKVDRLQENYDKISQECDALKQAILRQVFE